MKKFLALLIMATILSIWCIGCTNNSSNDFSFTDETKATIDDEDFETMLIDYCNNFYKNFQIECERMLYLENESISATVASEIQNKINDKIMKYINDESAFRETLGFYMPFIELGSIRAQEYLDTKYDWHIDPDTLQVINDYQYPLSEKYIAGIKEQFDILKNDYFKQ